jgi:TolB-like protein/Tfp pilus assembly protein PilF
VPVGYRGILILAALLEKPGEVVTKSVLIDRAWQGMVVEESNLSVQVASLRKLLGTSGSDGDWIVTIPRIGYRFNGVVEIRNQSISDRHSELGPSIAVLPFANISDDAEQQYFAEGLAEDIITRLGRLRSLLVTARNSSFAYRSDRADLERMGCELGVRYVLDGSVRRSGKRLRIGAELGDVLSGRQVWAERYDVDLADFLFLQDQISESVIAAIEPRIYAAEYQRFASQPPDSLDAWGFVMRAMPLVWTWGSAQEIGTAQSLLARAIEIDPDYARAKSLLAWTHAARVQHGWVDTAEALPLARQMAQQAIQRDPDDPWAHFAAGYVHTVSREHDQAVKELTESISLNPSFAYAHTILGLAYGYGGMPEDGLHECAHAARLSPRDFSQAGNFATSGLCHFVAGRFREAIECERKAVQLRPNFGPAWLTLTAAAGREGDLDMAAQALSEAVRLHPSLSLAWVEEHHAIVREKDRSSYIEGLRSAGLK